MSEFDNIFPVKTVTQEVYFNSKKNIFDFPIPNPEDASKIEYMQSDCGCANPRLLDDKVRVLYNDSHSAPTGEGSAVVKTKKTATVKFKDGKPLFVIDGATGEQILNPKKAGAILTLDIKVIA
jgi:hypothetical protein